jgi:hypothetical protein
MGITQEEIKRWKLEGWVFRVKKVNGNRYITRRKGNAEKGLGRFKEELWNVINQTPTEPSRLKLINEVYRAIESMLEYDRTIYLQHSCSHIVDEYCYFWKHRDKQFLNFIDTQLGEGYYKPITDKNGTTCWVFKVDYFYCKNCPAYK